jgi:hypothetical protein
MNRIREEACEDPGPIADRPGGILKFYDLFSVTLKEGNIGKRGEGVKAEFGVNPGDPRGALRLAQKGELDPRTASMQFAKKLKSEPQNIECPISKERPREQTS